MITKITHATLLVEDYAAAIGWYTEKLGLELRMDNSFGDGGRFATVGVKGQDVEIVLFKSDGGDGDSPSEQAGQQHSRLRVWIRRLSQGCRGPSRSRCKGDSGTRGGTLGYSGCL